MNMKTEWPVSTEALNYLGAEKADEVMEILKSVMNPLVIEYDDDKAKIIGGTFQIKIGDEVYDVPFKVKDE